MTEPEIAGLGPAFAAYLGRYRGCFLQKRTMNHFDTYCRGLLSDLPRKSVEPIALEAGTAVRTLQEFLASARWDHERARGTLQRTLAAAVAAAPADATGTVGVIDETSCRKWGDQTPGVQRQYLGCVGKLDNGIVTRPRRRGPGPLPGPAGRRPVPARVVGPGPPALPGRGHPRRRALPPQVADRPGPAGAAARQRRGLRLAGLRRGLRGGRAVSGSPGPGRPAFRGRGAGELRRPGPGRRPGAAGGRAADPGGRQGRTRCGGRRARRCGPPGGSRRWSWPSTRPPPR